MSNNFISFAAFMLLLFGDSCAAMRGSVNIIGASDVQPAVVVKHQTTTH